jgi:RNase adapter protein RapZ
MQLVLISGLSGSGKSIALNVLEDSGYYCVDNLPAQLLEQTVDLLRRAGHSTVAVSIDARTGASLDLLPGYITALRRQGVDVRVLFLDAKSETLIKRFSETRRRHPLAKGDLTLEEALERERELLSTIAETGQRIDTSGMVPNTLRKWIKDLLAIPSETTTLLFESFAYKQGIPLDADLVFDVRCVANPFYEPGLQPQTGLDPDVARFLESEPDVGALANDIGKFIESWLPAFHREHRNSLTIAIGCTGGRHRSPYFAERLGRRFRERASVLIRHRDLAP